jgi:hypothetical protein
MGDWPLVVAILQLLDKRLDCILLMKGHMDLRNYNTFVCCWRLFELLDIKSQPTSEFGDGVLLVSESEVDFSEVKIRCKS